MLCKEGGRGLTSPVRIVGIIPARYASSRFPGKPLALIAGKPLIQHVVERCQEARSLAEVINVQGDEPMIEPSVIDAVAGALKQGEVSTAATVVRCEEEFNNPNIVKVI